MRNRYLHIGTHKTATTSIQQRLHANADALRTRGVLLPWAEEGFGPMLEWHATLAKELERGRCDQWDRLESLLSRDASATCWSATRRSPSG